MDVTSAVKNRRIGALHAELLVDVKTRHGCRRATHHNADVLNGFVRELQRIEQSRCTDDGRAMLVVVHQWMSSSSFSRRSISNASGALMSSKLIPPNVGAMAFTVATNWSTSEASTSMSKTSMSATP